jgi:hypothetical protein
LGGPFVMWQLSQGVRSPDYAHRVEPEAAPPAGIDRAYTVAWELLEFTREMVSSLEDGATRIAAAQVAGVIALWTQLWTFEEGPPEVIAWVAWVTMIVAVSLLGPLVTPRRLARFWGSLPLSGLLAYDEPAKERAVLVEICETMQSQIRRLRRGMTVSIALGLSGLTLAAIAYVIEKAFYPP